MKRKYKKIPGKKSYDYEVKQLQNAIYVVNKGLALLNEGYPLEEIYAYFESMIEYYYFTRYEEEKIYLIFGKRRRKSKWKENI